MKKGPYSPSFVQSDGDFLFWNPETQKREACGTACTKSQGGGTCEKTKWVSGTRCAGCHSESRMKTIIIRCWRTWPAAVFDPAPPPSSPPALLPQHLRTPAAAAVARHAWPHAARCPASDSAQSKLIRRRSSSAPPNLPSGSADAAYLYRWLATPWHPVGSSHPTSPLKANERWVFINSTQRGARTCDCFVHPIVSSSRSPAGAFKASASRGGWEIFLIVASSVFHFPKGSNGYLIRGEVKKNYTFRHGFIFSTMLSFKYGTLLRRDAKKSNVLDLLQNSAYSGFKKKKQQLNNTIIRYKNSSKTKVCFPFVSFSLFLFLSTHCFRTGWRAFHKAQRPSQSQLPTVEYLLST